METRKNNLSLGILLIVLGSMSYGMLSTFVKLAYKQNYTTAEITVSQFLWGVIIVSILAYFSKDKAQKASNSDIKKLMISGIPMGLTSVLYYLSVRYIDASMAVVLLMQSVWMGVLFEAIEKKEFPSLEKIAAIVLIFFGTLLSTKVIGSTHAAMDIRGIVLGLLTAMSFSWTMYSTTNVANHLSPIQRSKFMLFGGLFVVTIFAFLTQVGPNYFNVHLISEGFIISKPFDGSIFLSYGLIVAIFGTIIPPIMLNKGFPIVGVGLGSILSSIELPLAIMIAFLFLGEVVNGLQWMGVATILLAIVLLNMKVFGVRGFAQNT